MPALNGDIRWAHTAKGFTLIEMVIVAGLVGIGALLVQTWIASQLPKWRLQGAVRQLVSDLQSSKMKAVMERNRQRVIFQDAHRYVLVDDDNNNGVHDPEERIEYRDFREAYHDVTLSATNNPSFLPRGTASNLASITLSNPAGKRTITVSITGRVKVKPNAS